MAEYSWMDICTEPSYSLSEVLRQVLSVYLSQQIEKKTKVGNPQLQVGWFIL